MKILSAEQQRKADQHTIANEPISSLQLMERAAGVCRQAILRRFPDTKRFRILCGSGNNGGDGLAMGRMLLNRGFHDTLCFRLNANQYSPDNAFNASRLQDYRPDALIHLPEAGFPADDKGVLWIDALFGTGLSRVPEGQAAAWIAFLNHQKQVVSVDVPSGLYSEGPTPPGQFVRATHTFTFHAPKEGFFYPSAGVNFSICDIGLDKDFTESMDSRLYCLDRDTVKPIYRPRQRHSHKGDYGHLLLVAGSADKPGAAVLAAKAALRSGCGLVTVWCPESVAVHIAAHCPEAMLQRAGKHTVGDISGLPEGHFDALAIGPGLGTAQVTAEAVSALLEKLPDIPLVGDADFLNILAADGIQTQNWQGRSLFTPHPGEFRRLAGVWADETEMFRLQVQFARDHQVDVILKGAYSCLSDPDGSRWFNPHGHAGMAKGGSGDVLTGLLGGLCAQGYSRKEAGLIGIWLHAIAGELAAATQTPEAMTALDQLSFLPSAWEELSGE